MSSKEEGKTTKKAAVDGMMKKKTDIARLLRWYMGNCNPYISEYTYDKYEQDSIINLLFRTLTNLANVATPIFENLVMKSLKFPNLLLFHLF